MSDFRAPPEFEPAEKTHRKMAAICSGSLLDAMLRYGLRHATGFLSLDLDAVRALAAERGVRG